MGGLLLPWLGEAFAVGLENWGGMWTSSGVRRSKAGILMGGRSTEGGFVAFRVAAAVGGAA